MEFLYIIVILLIAAIIAVPIARRTVKVFEEQDEKMLIDQHPFYDDEKQMIQSAQQVAQELERLLHADKK